MRSRVQSHELDISTLKASSEFDLHLKWPDGSDVLLAAQVTSSDPDFTYATIKFWRGSTTSLGVYQPITGEGPLTARFKVGTVLKNTDGNSEPETEPEMRELAFEVMGEPIPEFSRLGLGDAAIALSKGGAWCEQLLTYRKYDQWESNVQA